jgi:hypothetical protein
MRGSKNMRNLNIIVEGDRKMGGGKTRIDKKNNEVKKKKKKKRKFCVRSTDTYRSTISCRRRN